MRKRHMIDKTNDTTSKTMKNATCVGLNVSLNATMPNRLHDVDMIDHDNVQ